MVRTETLSKSKVRTLIADCFLDLIPEAERFAPIGGEADLEKREQAHYAQERINQLTRQLASGGFEADIEQDAIRALRCRGFAPSALTAATRYDLLEGFARALVEQQRLFLFRLDERLLPYTPADPLFMSDPSRCGELAPETPSRTCVLGPTVAEVVERHLAAKQRSWTAKTHDGRTRQLGYLVEHLGAATPISSVNAADLRDYRDAVTRLRSNHHVGAGKTFSARQTDAPDKRIAAKTASLIFEAAKAFLSWAKSEGYIRANPAEGLRVELPKTAKTHKARRPFTAAELEQLFSAPVFRGRKSATRRFEPGTLMVQDAYYWLPILGYLTGARLGELVQLHIGDIHVDVPIPYLEVTDANGGAVGSGDEKHVKSAAGVRKVPLHPDLIALGFPDFVETRSRNKRATKRLFFEIAYGADGQASTVFSKWFARLLDKVGLTDPALVFHSFRHTAEDALRNALQPQYVIDRLIGHADDATSAGYGEGVSLEVAAQAIKDMKHAYDIKSLGKA